MGKPRLFQIEFDNNVSTFLAGQNVTGKVLIESEQEINGIDGITLKFVGRSSVRWTETEQKTDSDGKSYSTQVTYSNAEQYFSHETYIFGNGNKTSLPAGIYNFPFAFVLPRNIPSSFEGTFGNVRYFAKSSFRRGGLFKFDYNVKVHFSVNSILDLNQEPNVQFGVEMTKSKRLCCLCCKSGPISAYVQIPRTGYAVGQVINISGEVDNKANLTLKSSYARLIKTTWFKATNKTRTQTVTVASVIKGSIQPGHSCLWDSEPLIVPLLPPSRLDFCNIINIAYSLVVILFNFDRHANMRSSGFESNGRWKFKQFLSLVFLLFLGHMIV